MSMQEQWHRLTTAGTAAADVAVRAAVANKACSFSWDTSTPLLTFVSNLVSCTEFSPGMWGTGRWVEVSGMAPRSDAGVTAAPAPMRESSGCVATVIVQGTPAQGACTHNSSAAAAAAPPAAADRRVAGEGAGGVWRPAAIAVPPMTPIPRPDRSGRRCRGRGCGRAGRVGAVGPQRRASPWLLPPAALGRHQGRCPPL